MGMLQGVLLYEAFTNFSHVISMNFLVLYFIRSRVRLLNPLHFFVARVYEIRAAPNPVGSDLLPDSARLFGDHQELQRPPPQNRVG